MQKFGIDISVWQKGFNFDKAKAEGVEFAILRGAYHTSKDKCFEDFYAKCKARSIPVGVYLYSMAKTVAEAKEEAAFLINNVLKGKQFEYPIYMDVEDKVQRKLGKKKLTEIVVAFCETLEAAGYYVGIYASASFFKSYLIEEKLTKYDKWVAQWNKECQYKGEYGLWQFGGESNPIRTNKVAGMVCDQDYAYKNYPAIIKATGLNGYSEPEKAPEPEKEDPVEVELPIDYAKSGPSKSRSGKYRVNAKAGLWLRTGASTSKPKLELMPYGSLVRCYGYYTGSWYCVISETGKTGFCHRAYLKKA